MSFAVQLYRMVCSILFIAALCVQAVRAETRINIPEQTEGFADREARPFQFENAILFKPAEAWDANELRLKLAPLLMEEVSLATATNGQHFGRLNFTKRKARFEANKPTLYFKSQRVEVNGGSHDQALFLWFYADSKTQRGKDSIVAQGIRITTDTNGNPAVWESLSGTSSRQQVYVSQSLEAAAASEFSNVLPGRSYVVENDVSVPEALSVARVISDGPTAMGPIIYVNAAEREIRGVLCRCMEPEARNLVDTRTYEIVVMDESMQQAISKLLKKASLPDVFDASAATAIAQRLRLPKSF